MECPYFWKHPNIPFGNCTNLRSNQVPCQSDDVFLSAGMASPKSRRRSFWRPLSIFVTWTRCFFSSFIKYTNAPMKDIKDVVEWWTLKSVFLDLKRYYPRVFVDADLMSIFQSSPAHTLASWCKDQLEPRQVQSRNANTSGFSVRELWIIKAAIFWAIFFFENFPMGREWGMFIVFFRRFPARSWNFCLGKASRIAWRTGVSRFFWRDAMFFFGTSW